MCLFPFSMAIHGNLRWQFTFCRSKIGLILRFVTMKNMKIWWFLRFTNFKDTILQSKSIGRYGRFLKLGIPQTRWLFGGKLPDIRSKTIKFTRNPLQSPSYDHHESVAGIRFMYIFIYTHIGCVLHLVV